MGLDLHTLIWLLSILLVSFVMYIISYIRFRKMIVIQTKQMIQLMKLEEVESINIGDIYGQSDEDFADLERAALGLRKKYLRLRKQSQEERKGYESVFSGLKEAIVSVNQDLKIISFNSSFMSFFNWAPINEHHVYYLYDVIRDPQIISTFNQTFQNNSVQKTEVESFQLFVTPLPSRIDSESWSLGVFYDLTEIRKTEKIRIDFVANASHEMRTPLTIVKGYSDLLEKKLLEKKMLDEVELLRPILQSSDQMSDLMDELLNLSKLDVSVILKKEWISTDQITQELIADLQPLLDMQKKKLKVENSASRVFANYESLMQILRNLLVNAIKYSGNSQLIQIKWLNSEMCTLLKVIDDGPGITLEHQDRIFERFYRVDKGRNRNQGGFGLGLALVKHHMLNHHGQIKLVSNLGIGSEFICEFPIEK